MTDGYSDPQGQGGNRGGSSIASIRPALRRPGTFYDRRVRYNRAEQYGDYEAILQAAHLCMLAELRGSNAPEHRIVLFPPLQRHVRLVSSLALREMQRRTTRPMGDCIAEVDGALPDSVRRRGAARIAGFKVVQKEYIDKDGVIGSTTKLDLVLESDRFYKEHMAAATAAGDSESQKGQPDAPPSGFVAMHLAEGHGFQLPPDFAAHLETQVGATLDYRAYIPFSEIPSVRPYPSQQPPL